MEESFLWCHWERFIFVNINYVPGKSTGSTSTAMRSPHRKVSFEKSLSMRVSFSEGKTKKEAEGEIKELEEKGVRAVDDDYAAIEDTGFDSEMDGQGTLRFYTKKYQEHKTQFDSLNNGKSTEEAKKEEAPLSKEGNGLELHVNVPSEIKEHFAKL